MKREIKRRQKEKERVKKRISARLVKKSASDVSNGGGEGSNSNAEEVSNSEDDDDIGSPVYHVRGLSCQCVMIVMCGIILIAWMLIPMTSQICFTV